MFPDTNSIEPPFLTCYVLPLSKEGVMEGNRISAVRERAGLSRYALANLAGITHSGLYQIEKGKRTASRETLEALSRALSVPLRMKPSRVYSELTGIDEKKSAAMEVAA